MLWDESSWPLDCRGQSDLCGCDARYYTLVKSVGDVMSYVMK